MKALAVLPCVLALAACSQKPPEPQAAPVPAATTARVATPWDDLKKDEQRARDVQKVVDQQDAQQRKQIEAAGQ
ncbi:hypothetical protein [Fulvimonas soli]|jgi:hypothetical protein|uniref:Lipoprotein n=1 Tax=Fulvimonas soli TaxID=155197 RepID=A0A316I0E0_9GAMM|nr:hypothetical protein [Fulvimonas soli]PWK85943.1 hypothetical protein C7456_108239 [Fulvimonas soli]TNY26692.1 hypothetical protein BV497_07330 [Fulvimonas soli]